MLVSLSSLMNLKVSFGKNYVVEKNRGLHKVLREMHVR